MRQKFTPQMSLYAPMASNSILKELEQVSRILDANPRILELVYEDLVKTSRPDTGRQGMTAEQVLRGAVLKQYRELTYEELAFHLEDSDAFRTFSRLEMGQYPSKSVLQENIKAIREETWEAIHAQILGYARQEKIETGRTISSSRGHLSGRASRQSERSGSDPALLPWVKMLRREDPKAEKSSGKSGRAYVEDSLLCAKAVAWCVEEYVYRKQNIPISDYKRWTAPDEERAP